jgi:hypothetical protein
MHEYVIEREYEQYFVYENNKRLLHAKVRDPALPLIPFVPETIKFYDNDGVEILISRLYTIFGIRILRKIRFQNGDSFKVKSKFLNTQGWYNGSKYTIMHRPRKKGDELYVNNILVGHLYRKAEGTSTYTHSITCDEEKYCYIFSVMNILFYRFDSN